MMVVHDADDEAQVNGLVSLVMVQRRLQVITVRRYARFCHPARTTQKDARPDDHRGGRW